MSEVITQPAGQRVLVLREGYLAICDGDACAAHLLNAAERWYAYKLKVRQESRGRNKAAQSAAIATSVPEIDEALWVRMGAKGWITDLLGQYSEKTVLDRLARLKKKGFLLSRLHPTQKWDKTPQWLFQRSAVQAALDAWAAARPTPDLDPSDHDGLGTENAKNADFPEAVKVPNASGNGGGMDGALLPNQWRTSTDSMAHFYRSNNTGFLNRDLLQDNKTTEAAKAAGGQAALGAGALPPKEETPTPPVALSEPEPHDPEDASPAPAPDKENLPGGGAAARRAAAAPKPGHEPSDFQRLFGAVALACYGTYENLTTTAKARVGTASRSLQRAKFTAEEIPKVAAWIRAKDTWRTDLSPQTLEDEAVKWRSQTPTTPPPAPKHSIEGRQDGTYYDPRSDPASPEYDTRFDSTHADFDPAYVLNHS